MHSACILNFLLASNLGVLREWLTNKVSNFEYFRATSVESLRMNPKFLWNNEIVYITFKCIPSLLSQFSTLFDKFVEPKRAFLMAFTRLHSPTMLLSDTKMFRQKENCKRLKHRHSLNHWQCTQWLWLSATKVTRWSLQKLLPAYFSWHATNAA